MGLYELLFGGSSENTKIDTLSKASIKRIARRAGIMYLPKNSYGKINQYFNNECSNTICKLTKLANHRGAKTIQSKDVHLLNLINSQIGSGYYENVTNTQQCGAGYPGYCDRYPGQCADSQQCGAGYPGYCDRYPGQCADSQQCGAGNNEYISNIADSDIYMLPHKTFKRLVKKKKSKNIRMTKKSVHNLHKYLENNINNELIFAKNEAITKKKGLVSIGDILLTKKGGVNKKGLISIGELIAKQV